MFLGIYCYSSAAKCICTSELDVRQVKMAHVGAFHSQIKFALSNCQRCESNARFLLESRAFEIKIQIPTLVIFGRNYFQIKRHSGPTQRLSCQMANKVSLVHISVP